MSIRKMIALHPDVHGHVNQPLGDAAHHLMYCARMCLSCADACAAEKMDMTQCIRLCLDCADTCDATLRVLSRQTEFVATAARAQVAACRELCAICALECERHAEHHEHCRICGEVCRRCEQACSAVLDAMGEPS